MLSNMKQTTTLKWYPRWRGGTQHHSCRNRREHNCYRLARKNVQTKHTLTTLPLGTSGRTIIL